jgi:hypothetical protein
MPPLLLGYLALMVNGLNPRLKRALGFFANERVRVTAFCDKCRGFANFNLVEDEAGNLIILRKLGIRKWVMRIVCAVSALVRPNCASPR